MIYRKGQRTNKHREAEYAFAVDIPIPVGGLGQNLNLIHREADACAGRTEVWGHRTREPGRMPEDWCRIGTNDISDAERLTKFFSHLDARRVR